MYTELNDGKDSCVEFFFSPEENDGRYFNFEFNPALCMHLGLGSCRNDSARILPRPSANIQPSVIRTDDGWDLTYQITVEFIKNFTKKQGINHKSWFLVLPFSS